MPIVTDAKEGKKLSEYLDTGNFKKVLLISFHGVGDQVMFLAPFEYLKRLYPDIRFEVGLAKGLQEEFIIKDHVIVDGDWKEIYVDSDYDLVFACHFPLERLEDLTKTKAEVCCEEELGIPPISGHLNIKRKPIVGFHFSNTSVAWLANTPEEVAQKVWNEVKEAGCIPVETLFKHAFYNDGSEKFGFVDNHVRNWPANLDTCISLISHCDYFIGAVSGNFHIALSVLPYTKVALLENKLKVEHFTKLPVKRFDVEKYVDGCVYNWIMKQEVRFE